MKKIICIIGVIYIMVSLSGCNLRTNELNSGYPSEKEAIKRVEETVIQALETKDEELLKSIFSEKALSKAGDIDRGIEYIFNLYKGNFIEIIEENHSTDEHIEKNKSTKDIAAWCIIKTSEGLYKMSWVEWIKQESDPSAVGVYKLQMREYIEDDYRSYGNIAGINYPERDISHNFIAGIIDTFYNKQYDIFPALLSTELLSKADTDAQINKLTEMLSAFMYSDIEDGWVTYEEVDGREKMNVYVEIEIHIDKGSTHKERVPHIMYFSFDDVEKDKISVFQLYDYSSGIIEEEKTEPGIYLP